MADVDYYGAFTWDPICYLISSITSTTIACPAGQTEYRDTETVGDDRTDQPEGEEGTVKQRGRTSFLFTG